MTTTIWHNPRCSKSRQTLALLEEHGVTPTVRLYLEDAPSASEVSDVVTKLGITPWDLLRRGEKVFKELGLSQQKDNEAIIEAMAQHPILIERPIVIHAGAAALGRPPENVLGLID
jgi:arsenate reductase